MPVGRPRRWRITALFATAGAGGAAVAIALATHPSGWTGRTAVAPAGAGAALATTRISRQTLVESLTIPGRLGYGPAEAVDSKAAGTVTWLPRPGAILARGDALLRADEKPVVVFYGPLPMYRPLSVRTKGRDVEQFERNLATLGYSGFGVDQEFTEHTAAAVKRWQSDIGVQPTGVVEVARVAYLPGPVRVAGLSLRVGSGATGEALTYTADERVVTVDASAAGACGCRQSHPRQLTCSFAGGDGRA